MELIESKKFIYRNGSKRNNKLVKMLNKILWEHLRVYEFWNAYKCGELLNAYNTSFSMLHKA